jgi:hypothetical protein
VKSLVISVVLVGSIAATAVVAAPPAGAPSGTTAMCKDGSYSSSAEKRGACSGHDGVKTWYGEETAAFSQGSKTAVTTTTTTTPAPPSTAAAHATPTTTTRNTSTTSVGQPSTPVTAQASGRAGQVWVNTNTKVYHCSGDPWYGKTKQGEYLSESDAKAQGFRPEHGKACS